MLTRTHCDRQPNEIIIKRWIGPGWGRGARGLAVVSLRMSWLMLVPLPDNDGDEEDRKNRRRWWWLRQRRGGRRVILNISVGRPFYTCTPEKISFNSLGCCVCRRPLGLLAVSPGCLLLSLDSLLALLLFFLLLPVSFTSVGDEFWDLSRASQSHYPLSRSA